MWPRFDELDFRLEEYCYVFQNIKQSKTDVRSFQTAMEQVVSIERSTKTKDSMSGKPNFKQQAMVLFVRIDSDSPQTKFNFEIL